MQRSNVNSLLQEGAQPLLLREHPGVLHQGTATTLGAALGAGGTPGQYHGRRAASSLGLSPVHSLSVLTSSL